MCPYSVPVSLLDVGYIIISIQADVNLDYMDGKQQLEQILMLSMSILYANSDVGTKSRISLFS